MRKLIAGITIVAITSCSPSKPIIITDCPVDVERSIASARRMQDDLIKMYNDLVVKYNKLETEHNKKVPL